MRSFLVLASLAAAAKIEVTYVDNHHERQSIWCPENVRVENLVEHCDWPYPRVVLSTLKVYEMVSGKPVTNISSQMVLHKNGQEREPEYVLWTSTNTEQFKQRHVPAPRSVSAPQPRYKSLDAQMEAALPGPQDIPSMHLPNRKAQFVRDSKQRLNRRPVHKMEKSKREQDHEAKMKAMTRRIRDLELKTSGEMRHAWSGGVLRRKDHADPDHAGAPYLLRAETDAELKLRIEPKMKLKSAAATEDEKKELKLLKKMRVLMEQIEFLKEDEVVSKAVTFGNGDGSLSISNDARMLEIMSARNGIDYMPEDPIVNRQHKINAYCGEFRLLQQKLDELKKQTRLDNGEVRTHVVAGKRVPVPPPADYFKDADNGLESQFVWQWNQFGDGNGQPLRQDGNVNMYGNMYGHEMIRGRGRDPPIGHVSVQPGLYGQSHSVTIDPNGHKFEEFYPQPVRGQPGNRARRGYVY